MRGAEPGSDADLAAQRRVVDAFLAAARAGDFDALVAVLDPDVVFRVDTRPCAVAARPSRRVQRRRGRGERRSSRAAPRFAAFARPAVVNGAAGLVVAPASGTPFAVIGFTVVRGRIREIDLIADPEKLRGLAVDA